MAGRDDAIVPVQPNQGVHLLALASLHETPVEVHALSAAGVGTTAHGPPVGPERLHLSPESAVALKALMPSSNADLRIDLDPDTGRAVVRLTNPETGELIRQIPSEEILRIARSIDRYLGLMVDAHG